MITTRTLSRILGKDRRSARDGKRQRISSTRKEIVTDKCRSARYGVFKSDTADRNSGKSKFQSCLGKII